MNPNEIEELFAEGMSLIEQKEFEEALDVFNELAELDPDNIDVFFQKGYVLNRINRPREAEICFNIVLVMEPKNVDALIERAASFCSWGSYPSAIDDLNAVLKIDPFNEDALFYRAKTYIAKGKPESATGDLTRLITKYPNREDLYILRGQAYLSLNITDCAEKDFRMALILKPGLAEGFRMKGKVLEHAGNPDGALSDYKKAAKLGPESPIYQYDIGRIYLLKGQTEEALVHLEKSLELDKDNSTSWQVIPMIAKLVPPETLLEPILDLAVKARGKQVLFTKIEQTVQVSVVVYGINMPLMFFPLETLTTMENNIGQNSGIEIFKDRNNYSYEYNEKKIQVETIWQKDEYGNTNIILNLNYPDEMDLLENEGNGPAGLEGMDMMGKNK